MEACKRRVNSSPSSEPSPAHLTTDCVANSGYLNLPREFGSDRATVTLKSDLSELFLLLIIATTATPFRVAGFEVQSKVANSKI